MQTILTAVERQQGTTAATLIRRGQKESGAIRPIQTRDGTHATFHSAVLSMVGQSISAYNVYFFQKKNRNARHICRLLRYFRLRIIFVIFSDLFTSHFSLFFVNFSLLVLKGEWTELPVHVYRCLPNVRKTRSNRRCFTRLFYISDNCSSSKWWHRGDGVENCLQIFHFLTT